MRVRMYPNPKFGVEKSEYLADPLVAHLGKVTAKTTALAAQRMVIAKAILASHHRTGSSFIDMSKGETDTFVSLMDLPSNGAKYANAMAVEGQTQALSTAFGLSNDVDAPNVLHDEKGKYVKQYGDD